MCVKDLTLPYIKYLYFDCTIMPFTYIYNTFVICDKKEDM